MHAFRMHGTRSASITRSAISRTEALFAATRVCFSIRFKFVSSVLFNALLTTLAFLKVKFFADCNRVITQLAFNFCVHCGFQRGLGVVQCTCGRLHVLLSCFIVAARCAGLRRLLARELLQCLFGAHNLLISTLDGGGHGHVACVLLPAQLKTSEV